MSRNTALSLEDAGTAEPVVVVAGQKTRHKTAFVLTAVPLRPLPAAGSSFFPTEQTLTEIQSGAVITLSKDTPLCSPQLFQESGAVPVHAPAAAASKASVSVARLCPAHDHVCLADLHPASLAARDQSSSPPGVGEPDTNMLFSDLYKSPKSTFYRLKNALPHSEPAPAEQHHDADLESRDKQKRKEAVKRFLRQNIHSDWEFQWPPQKSVASVPSKQRDGLAAATPRIEFVTTSSTNKAAGAIAPGPSVPLMSVLDGASTDSQAGGLTTFLCSSGDDVLALKDSGEETDVGSDVESVYSTLSEDAIDFRPRAEWTSEEEEEQSNPASSLFDFESPDVIGVAVQSPANVRATRRRRALREEMTWNDGLACFTARRDAWTGAKTVRIRSKPPELVSPTSSRRLFWQKVRSESAAPQPMVPLSPTVTRVSEHHAETFHPLSGSNTEQALLDHELDRQPFPSSTTAEADWLIATILPISPPLFPPQNPMRASVTPAIYPSLYDKLIVQSMQPSCPVNLADVLRACVVGWKRDGEWPPKPTQLAPGDISVSRWRKQERPGSARRRSFGFLVGKVDEQGHENGGALRRRLHKVLSLGQGSSQSHGGNDLSPQTSKLSRRLSAPHMSKQAAAVG